MLPARLKNRPWTRVHVRGLGARGRRNRSSFRRRFNFGCCLSRYCRCGFLGGRASTVSAWLQARLGIGVQRGYFDYFGDLGLDVDSDDGCSSSSQVLALRFQVCCSGLCSRVRIEDVCHCCVLRNPCSLSQPCWRVSPRCDCRSRMT